jgi:hypothetical protein
MKSDVHRYQSTREGLRAVAFKEIFGEHSAYVVIGLEYDICSQGRSLEHAIKNFETCLGVEERICFEMGKSFPQNIGPSPQRYHDLWEQSASLALYNHLGIEILPIYEVRF